MKLILLYIVTSYIKSLINSYSYMYVDKVLNYKQATPPGIETQIEILHIAEA